MNNSVKWIIPWWAVIVAGVVMGFIVVTILPIVWIASSRASLDHPWTATGLSATLTGLLAAFLGILFAVIVAIQWLRIDKRMEDHVQNRLTQMQAELLKVINVRLQATAELAMAFSALMSIEDREARVFRVLQLDPSLPNAASLMALAFIVAASQDRQNDKFLNRAQYWAEEAFKTSASQDPGFPERVMALVFAMRKEPQACMRYLRQSIERGGISADAIRADPWTWRIFSSLAHGENQLGEMDDFSKLVGAQRPTPEELGSYIRQIDETGSTTFWAVGRSDGNAVKVTVHNITGQGAEAWKISAPVSIESESLPELVERILQNWIPTLLP